MINMKIKKDCLMKHKIFLLVQGLLFTGLLSAQVVHTDSTFSEKMIPIAYGEAGRMGNDRCDIFCKGR